MITFECMRIKFPNEMSPKMRKRLRIQFDWFWEAEKERKKSKIASYVQFDTNANKNTIQSISTRRNHADYVAFIHLKLLRSNIAFFGQLKLWMFMELNEINWKLFIRFCRFLNFSEVEKSFALTWRFEY